MQKPFKVFELGQKGCIQVLLLLSEKRELTMTELIRNLDITQDPIYKALPILKSLDLIVETHEKVFPRRRIFKLTEKGKEAAKKLREIENLLT